MTIDAVVVTYNAAPYIEDAIRRIMDQKLLERCVVVDNASSDGTRPRLRALAEEFDDLVVIESRTNSGFSRACNQGFEVADAPVVAYLNPDVLLPETDILASAAEHLSDQVGLVGVRLQTADGSFDHAAKRYEPTVLGSLLYLLNMEHLGTGSNSYRALDVGERETAFVDSVNGAFIIASRDLMEELEGFDERFWMYAEDLDLCRRVRETGRKVKYVGSLTAIHLKGASDGGRRSPRVSFHFAYSMALYVLKHHSLPTRLFLVPAIVLGGALYGGLALLRRTIDRAKIRKRVGT